MAVSTPSMCCSLCCLAEMQQLPACNRNRLPAVHSTLQALLCSLPAPVMGLGAVGLPGVRAPCPCPWVLCRSGASCGTALLVGIELRSSGEEAVWDGRYIVDEFAAWFRMWASVLQHTHMLSRITIFIEWLGWKGL